MEESSEQRRERLRAMREEATALASSNDSDSIISSSHGSGSSSSNRPEDLDHSSTDNHGALLLPPPAPSSPPGLDEPASRFEFYTDPLAAFSSASHRKKPKHRDSMSPFRAASPNISSSHFPHTPAPAPPPLYDPSLGFGSPQPVSSRNTPPLRPLCPSASPKQQLPLAHDVQHLSDIWGASPKQQLPGHDARHVDTGANNPGPFPGAVHHHGDIWVASPKQQLSLVHDARHGDTGANIPGPLPREEARMMSPGSNLWPKQQSPLGYDTWNSDARMRTPGSNHRQEWRMKTPDSNPRPQVGRSSWGSGGPGRGPSPWRSGIPGRTPSPVVSGSSPWNTGKSQSPVGRFSPGGHADSHSLGRSVNRGSQKPLKHQSVSARDNPELFVNKSMVLDPWKDLVPVRLELHNWLPKSIQEGKLRISDMKLNLPLGGPSLADSLAASLDEAVSDTRAF